MDKAQFLKYLNDEFGKKENTEKFQNYSVMWIVQTMEIMKECCSNHINYDSAMDGSFNTAHDKDVFDDIMKNHQAFKKADKGIEKYSNTGLFAEVEGMNIWYSMLKFKKEVKKSISSSSKLSKILSKHEEVINSYSEKLAKAAALFEEYEKISGFDPHIEEKLISIDEAVQEGKKYINLLK